MNKRVYWIDLLRIFAILAVVMIHLTYNGTYLDSTKYHNIWLPHMILDCVSQFAVPIFVMISGYLHLKKDRSIKYYIKNSLKLILIFFIVSISYAFYNNFYILNSTDYDFKNILLSTFSGEYHLWFLPMLAGLYLLTPLIKPILDNKKCDSLIKYYLIIWFIINAISQFSFLFTDSKTWQYTAYNFYQKLYIPFVSSYLGYYILGFYLSKLNLSKIKQIFIYSFGLISIILSVYLSNTISYYPEYNKYSFMGSMYPLYIIYSSSIFLFFKNVISKIQFNNIFTHIINILSKSVIIVYLIHVFIIKYLIKNYDVTFNTINSNEVLLKITKYFIITSLSSFLISIIIVVFLLAIKYVIFKRYNLIKLNKLNYNV